MNSKKTRKINTDIHERVLRFISLFKGAEAPFLHGCCYWFAAILEARFKGSVLYASPPGHFVCQILNRLYDVTGDVTEAYGNVDRLFSMEDLEKYEPRMFEDIMDASILMTDKTEEAK